MRAPICFWVGRRIGWESHVVAMDLVLRDDSLVKLCLDGADHVVELG
jgi:hypothetical protein